MFVLNYSTDKRASVMVHQNTHLHALMARKETQVIKIPQLKW